MVSIIDSVESAVAWNTVGKVVVGAYVVSMDIDISNSVGIGLSPGLEVGFVAAVGANVVRTSAGNVGVVGVAVLGTNVASMDIDASKSNELDGCNVGVMDMLGPREGDVDGAADTEG